MNNRRNRFALFFKHSLIGGLTVLLPITIIFLFAQWFYQTLSGVIAPVTTLLADRSGLNHFGSNALLLLLLILICFLLGNFISTRAGDWLWGHADSWMVKRVPGYRLVRDLVQQFVGDKNHNTTGRGEVAMVWLYGRDTPISVNGIITARHVDGRVTVFVPCGPNPTTGFVYHVDGGLVDPCPHIKVEQLMKMVVACGVGSQPMVASSKPTITE